MDGIVNIAITCGVSDVLIHQCLDHRDHALNVAGGAGLVSRRDYPERGCILIHRPDETVCQGLYRFVVFLRTFDYLVIDIGDIANVIHIKTTHLQPPDHHIEYHHHPSMAEMAVIIYRHTADVETGLAWGQRDKVLLGPGEGVIDLEH